MRIEQKNESGVAVPTTKCFSTETQRSLSHYFNSPISASLWFLARPRYTQAAIEARRR
jgi:hypothetical protein